MIRIVLQPTPESISIFKKKGAQILAALVARMDKLMIELQAHIVSQKLSGQVLQRRTGILASSVAVEPTQIDGKIIRGAVQSSGGPAYYGQIHELGGERSFDIFPSRAKVLRFIVDGRTVFAKSVHRLPVPQRSFMATSLDEMKQYIEDSIEETFFSSIEAT